LKIVGNPTCSDCGAAVGYLRVWPTAKVVGGETVAGCRQCGGITTVHVDAPDDDDVKMQSKRESLARRHRSESG